MTGQGSTAITALRGAIWWAGTGDYNHVLYNNYLNRDGLGGFDGMRWMLYDGIQFYCGNRSGAASLSGLSLCMNSSGNVGIGTASPSQKLHISGGDPHTLYGPSATYNMNLSVGSGGSLISSTTADITCTNGNLHIDSAASGAAGRGLYLNYFTSGQSAGGNGSAILSYGPWTHTGVISNQTRPMSMVGKNNGGVTNGIMVFNAVAYNVGSMYNSSNGRWTASVAGYYQFTYSGISRYVTAKPNNRWNKNGNDFGWGATHSNFSNVGVPYYMQQACSLIVFLAVNDYVEFNVVEDGFYGDSTIHNTACCIFLG